MFPYHEESTRCGECQSTIQIRFRCPFIPKNQSDTPMHQSLSEQLGLNKTVSLALGANLLNKQTNSNFPPVPQKNESENNM